MADDLAQPHDSLFRAVFGDPAEAAGLLRAHLPEAVANGLDWSTLTVEKSHFVAPELRATESDLLYSIRRRAGGRSAWLYVLLEHQSTTKPRERWLRLRLLRYCCRIWERDRRRHPDETELRPIVPLVLYQGRGRWRHATEFSDLFAREVRAWPWLPRFEHLLIDQSATAPEEVRGTLRGMVAQLMMMAVYRAAGGWPALQRALPLLAELERRGGMEELGMFVIYVLATQDEPMRRRFAKELQRHVPGPGGDAMNYVEELIKQGRQKGRLEERVGTVEDFLRAGASWSLIESATGMDPAALRALKQRLEAASTTTEPNETSANGAEEAE